jgi:hypothetical protein
MSDEEFDEESFRAYENELYGEQTDRYVVQYIDYLFNHCCFL